MDKKLRLTSNALCFSDPGCFAVTSVEEASVEEAKPKLNMKIYSGSVIKGHWYWGNLVIDLKGIDADKDKYPILEDHDPSRKIGFSSKPIVKNDGVYIDPENAFFVDTPASQEFIKLSKQGFPFQSSISIVPLAVERLDDGVETTVNGFSFKGPGAVFRKSLYREASVCVFGWDSNTASTAMSKSNDELELVYDEVILGKEDEESMDLNELKEKFPDLVKAIQDEVRAEFSQKTQPDETTKLITELSEKLKASEEKVRDLEKKDAIRTEREIALRAENIWTVKLKDSALNENLYAKIRNHVSHTSFVSNGVFDEEKFSEAVDAEIKEWESLITVPSPVIGTSFSKNNAVNDIEKTVSELAALAGIK